MRTAEIALLLVPVALVIAWALGIRGLSRSGMIAAGVAFITMAALLFWLGEGRSVRGAYVPAQLRHGAVVPGGGTAAPR